MDSFFSELRRRNVLRLAATYALAAWILIEAGSVLLPTFGVPDWFFKAYVLVIFAGFIVSLVLAWVFEVTPEGVKLESEIDRSRGAPRPRGKSNAIIIALLVAALGVSITFNVTGIRGSGTPADSAAASSIAVLPFTSRSSDPDNQFFADGIHDDLLTRLAEIESLRVISRTSVNEYRDTTKNLRDIGAELGVTTVVEGAVQRSGDQVRITVQLIDAATDEHLWADSFDRELTMQNVFAIQSEISSQIASALRAALTPENEIRIAAIPTKSIEALASYTAGRNNLSLRRLDALIEARSQFERAIELDADYAQAYAGLAETIMVTQTNHLTIGEAEAKRLASEALQKALELDDRLAEAHAVKGLLEYREWIHAREGTANLDAAASFQRAIDLNPNYANAYVWFSTLRDAEGSVDAAIELLTKAMRIDPLGRIAYVNLPGLYVAKGKHDKALELLVKAMDIFPDWPMPYKTVADHLFGLGRLDEATAWAFLAMEMTEDPINAQAAFVSYSEFGDLEKMRELSDRFEPTTPMRLVTESFIRFTNSDYEGAIAVFEGSELDSDMEGKYVYPMISKAAIKLGDYTLARDNLLRFNPLLSRDAEKNVDRQNLGDAILLAYIYKQTGEDQRAAELLAEASQVIRSMPRIGAAGYGISDVHILAIQGRRDAALDALRDAIDEGVVTLMPYDYWTLDQDPIIDSLRSDDRFRAMKIELDEKIEDMRDNVERAQESGDWSELLGRIRKSELTAALVDW